MPAVLSVDQLTKYYGSLRALNQISFNIPEECIFGILGPNGSGKTTLLGIVTDVLKASSGTYRWFGQDNSPILRKRIGTLLETPNFFPYLSARDNLFINATIKNCDKHDVERVLDMTGLSERANSKFSTYSLGMKQRLALAAAMLKDPSVIVLDEPTNGLDPTGIADIRNIIQHMGQMGKTVIMASHLLDEVEKVCTHVAILKKGELLASGSVNEVLSNDPVIVVASADLQALEQVMMKFPGIKAVKNMKNSLQLTVAGNITNEQINQFCFEHHITLSRLQQMSRNLEHKFIELTRERQP